MGKRKKSKGKRRGGKKRKKGGYRVKKHKPGIAETLGILKSVFDIETSDDVFAVQRDVILRPSVAQMQMAVDRTVTATKNNAGPAILGIVVSNVDKLPIIGRPVAPLKHKLDRILKAWIGMRL